MKKGRLFAKIIYYLFTFVIGILLAFGLPYYFRSFSVPMQYAAEMLREESYDKAILLAEARSFNRNSYYTADMERGGSVLFCQAVSGTTKTLKPAHSDRQQSYTELRRCYLGYVYGVRDTLSAYSEQGNRLAIVAKDGNGNEQTYPLADYDADGDGTKDGVTTFNDSGYIIVELYEDTLAQIDSISLLDSDGNEYWTSGGGLDWTFDNDYFGIFDTVALFNEQSVRYAETYLDPDVDRNVIKEEIDELENSYRSSCQAQEAYYFLYDTEPLYVETDREIMHRSDIKAIPFVVVYFVVIYVIGDFLLGDLYIVKFFNWFLFKVCKIPRKGKKAPKKEDVFGHDYYSMVTLALDLSEAPDFVGSVEIKYTNSDAEVKWTLLKAENYASTQRIKAGVYVNPHIDINAAYAPVDLPDNLEIEGYKVEKTVKIIKREV